MTHNILLPNHHRCRCRPIHAPAPRLPFAFFALATHLSASRRGQEIPCRPRKRTANAAAVVRRTTRIAIRTARTRPRVKAKLLMLKMHPRVPTMMTLRKKSLCRPCPHLSGGNESHRIQNSMDICDPAGKRIGRDADAHQAIRVHPRRG